MREKFVIPYSRQSISASDIGAVIRILKSPFLTQGPAVEEFERALCRYTGAKYCVAVANGTAALHLAVAVLELNKGCSGVTSPITFLASANAMVYNGIRPLFADIDISTGNVSIDQLTNVVCGDTKVIVPVHFAGRPVDMKAIQRLANKKGCFLIEDAAHAIGSRYPDGGRVGNCAYSDMTAFSFHPVKTITTGEGGAVTTNNRRLFQRLRLLRSHGVTKDRLNCQRYPGPWHYEMQALGFNYRLTDIQASLGMSQLRRIERFIARRRRIVCHYNKAFQGLAGVMPLNASEAAYAYHLYVLLFDFKYLKLRREDVVKELKMRGVGTQIHYEPVYRQPYYRKTFGFRPGLCPNAEEYYKRCLSLPLFPAMKDGEVRQVIDAIYKVCRK